MMKQMILLLGCIAICYTGVAQTNTGPEKDTEEEVYTIVEEMPVFPGGQDSLMRYLASINYPKEARDGKIEGSVYVSFVIMEDGSLGDIEVVRSAHPLLDEATVNHIAAMPRWKPGVQKGKPVRVAYTLPMRFVLDTKKQNIKE